MKAKVKVYLNPMSKSMVQLSVKIFHFVKPGLVKHVLLSLVGFSRLNLWNKFQSVAIQMKAIEAYFPVVLFIMPYKVVPTFESVDKILKCDHSNESY